MALCASVGMGPDALGDAFDDYALVGQFELPDGDQPYDALPDGRLITLVSDVVHLETALGSRTFVALGGLPDADLAPFGAAFIRVSPDGTRIAVGNNGGSSFSDFEVGVFDVGTLDGTWYTAAHFQATWFDDTHLGITAGAFGQPAFVTVLDTTSPDPLNPINPVVVEDIGGASAGLAFDAADRLFTGNGFTGAGPSGTGTIKAFEAAAWMPALSGGAAVDFETQGTVVAEVLSASPMVFDFESHLAVGGGDVDPDADAIALVRNTALAAAVAGMGAVDETDPSEVRYLDPIPDNDFNFYSVLTNPVTGELYARDFAATTVHVYLPASSIPTASEIGLVILAGGLLGCGGVVIGRRRIRG